MKPPTQKTLARYGLSAGDWLDILERQGTVCAVCKRMPPSGRLVVDHDHIKGWKKLPPEKRRLHVRGLLCWLPCNRYYVGRSITIERSESVTAYLRDHRERVVLAGLGLA